MGEIAKRLIAVQERIRAAEIRYHRPTDSVKLVAVTKLQPIEKIIEAIEAGHTCFGENIVAEAIPKIKALAQYDLEWHFLGALQSNKTHSIAEHFNWAHSLTRDKIAARLSAQRAAHASPLNVCVQVNVNNDPSKQGVSLAKLIPLAEMVSKLSRLKLRGLMTIATLNGHTDPLLPFRSLRMAKEYLQEIGIELDTLSMGMSDDFEAAIAEGATIVRVGSAIFGERTL